jgi:hypothetical protein
MWFLAARVQAASREQKRTEIYMQDEVRRLVPVPEAMGMLGGIGRTKVYELISGGEITKVNIGSRSFITAESLEMYLERLVAVAHGSSGADDGTAATPDDAGAVK